MSSVTQTRAVVQRGGTFVEETVQIPDLDSHEILVRIHYAALNPTDNLAFQVDAFGDGAVLGCDFAGTVEKLGSKVSRFAVGDRIATFIWGGERPGIGAFSEYCIADERIAFQVPSNINLEQAATIPLAATTAYLALFSNDCLHLERSKPPIEPLLILGGSSSVGSFTNQIAAIHGIRTVATASKKNADVVTKDGASAIFDYSDPNIIQKIQESYPDLDHVFDTIGKPESALSAKTLLSDKGGVVCTVRPGKVGTEDFPANIEVHDVFVFTAFLKEHNYRGKFHWPVNEHSHDLSAKFYAQLHDLIANGRIRPRPVKNLGKLSSKSVLEGIELVKTGGLSNEKVCFTVYDGGKL